jgi:hypothetical protein
MELATRLGASDNGESMLFRVFDIRNEAGDINHFLQTDLTDEEPHGCLDRWAWAQNSYQAMSLQLIEYLITLQSIPYCVWRLSFYDIKAYDDQRYSFDIAHCVLSGIYGVATVLTHFCTSCTASHDLQVAIEIFSMRKLVAFKLRHWTWWWDFFSFFDLPFQIVCLATTGTLDRSWMVLQFLRVRHLLQVPSFLHYMNSFHILRLCVITFFTAHVIACVWWRVVNSSGTTLQHFAAT